MSVKAINHLKHTAMKKIIKQEQWVMLPTKENSQFGIQANGVIKQGNVGIGTYQHLYLTSDDEIKGGDWCITETNELIQIGENGNQLSIKRIKNNTIIEFDENPQGIEKIIATTDKSLKIPINKHLIRLEEADERDETFLLPQIPESFIKYYVEKQGKVGDVDVELEKDNYYYNARVIIPKEEEKMYSRDDVTQMLVDYSNDLMNMKLRGNVADSVNQWIKENL